ncbi:7651_t:CDS:1, partial [Funneliformis geosporum]
YSKEGLILSEKINEKSIHLIQNEEQQTETFQIMNIIREQDVYSEFIKEQNSKKNLHGRGLGLCKKALILAIENKSNQAL